MERKTNDIDNDIVISCYYSTAAFSTPFFQPSISHLFTVSGYSEFLASSLRDFFGMLRHLLIHLGFLAFFNPVLV